MLTLTSKYLPLEDIFKTKLKAKFNKYEQNFQQLEGQLVDFIEQQHQ